MEKVFGRHQARSKRFPASTSGEAGAIRRTMAAVRWRGRPPFEDDDGRRPRILVAKMGQDGHDRGQKVIASAFADLGFDVDIGPLFQTPEEAARQAVENDVHIVGVSSLAAGHLTLVPALKRALAAEGARHHDRRRRRDPAAGLRRAAGQRRRRRDLRSGRPGTVIADAAMRSCSTA
jgi:methylmalonyl-CoA mutase